MERSTTLVLFLALLMCWLVAPVCADEAADITAEQVRTAIDKGVKFLKSQQKVSERGEGYWSEHAGEPGGLTALCTLSLINAGVPVDDVVIQRALRYLRSARFNKPRRTYSTSLRTMVFCAAEPDRDRVQIRANVAWLQSIQVTGASENRGAWAYSEKQGGGDRSNTQFAMLALHEAERVGVQTQAATWRLAKDYWMRTQQFDGAWNYFPGTASTGSMTCAGIASLVIASTHISKGDAQIVGDGVRCCGEQERADEIERALQWLGSESRFSVRHNPTGGGRGASELGSTWHFYYLYALERVGRLTGRRFVGDRIDWYREGAKYLVKVQDGFTGQWKGVGRVENNALIGTSFALLFLSKGRRPVVISQLRHARNNDWIRHREGVGNLTRFVETIWKRDLTWQTIDLEKATVEDLLQTPVLFISGCDALDLTKDQKKLLRQYVEQGGFIFAEACEGNGCSGTAFDKAFRELMRELFPDNPMRLLPQDHPMWYAERRVPPEHAKPLYGIDACCRTSVVFCPQPLSCYWELSKAVERDETISKEVAAQVEAASIMGANVLAYATGRQLKDKLDDRTVEDDDEAFAKMMRGTVSVVKLKHGGGHDDAPAALVNLMKAFGQETRIPVGAKRGAVSIRADNLSRQPIVFMHGRRAFRLTDADRKALREYLDRGGFLFADAICASEPFANAFREEIRQILPDTRISRIPIDHKIFSTEFGGTDLKAVAIRDPQARTEDDPLKAATRLVTPYLEGVEVDDDGDGKMDRYAVIFSPYDISCAMENAQSMQCKGYQRVDAARVAINVLLYALQQ
jgi:hypothetical protein